MAADQLVVDVLGDLRQRPGAALLQQQAQELHLEQHVAELVEQLAVVAGVRGVRQLVGLLDGVRDDRALVLLAIPGAVPAQAPRQGVQPRERYGCCCTVVVVFDFGFGAFLHCSIT